LADPRVIQAIAAMTLGQRGASAVPVGNTAVPVGAVANLIGQLAQQALSEHHHVARFESEVPSYLVDRRGRLRCDPMVPRERAEVLLELLQDSMVEGNGGEGRSTEGNEHAEHVTPEDLATSWADLDGIPDAFDRNRVMDDAFFVDANAVSAEQVQVFLERTPYGRGRRCFLADTRVGGRLAAAAIVEGAQSQGINPIVMLARMQVEKGLISKSRDPGGRTVDYAFGCGCPDGKPCNPTYRGLDRQIECAARTLRRHYDASVDGTGAWRRGQARQTLDPIAVTPHNHATASLYAYTPWVLVGKGGNWLVWNVTRRFAQHFQELGVNLTSESWDEGDWPDADEAALADADAVLESAFLEGLDQGWRGRS
jgi:hypothetical protein